MLIGFQSKQAPSWSRTVLQPEPPCWGSEISVTTNSTWTCTVQPQISRGHPQPNTKPPSTHRDTEQLCPRSGPGGPVILSEGPADVSTCWAFSLPPPGSLPAARYREVTSSGCPSPLWSPEAQAQRRRPRSPSQQPPGIGWTPRSFAAARLPRRGAGLPWEARWPRLPPGLPEGPRACPLPGEALALGPLPANVTPGSL